MKKLTLKDIHHESLKILLDIHEFCVDNGIHYSLGYGTLIGAIRHKGFIPWDDDIDIVFTRPEYEKFCNTYKSKNGYKLFFPEDGSSYLSYARVCDCENTIVREFTWCNEVTGLWIDIFPLDAVDRNENRESVLQEMKALRIEQNHARSRKGKFYKNMPLIDAIRLFAKKIIFCRYDISSINRKVLSFAQRLPYSASELIGNKTIPVYYKKDFYPKEYFSDYVLVEFENYKFYAMKGYDQYLRTIYGDYMQLPPVEKRKQHPHKIYWKNETK